MNDESQGDFAIRTLDNMPLKIMNYLRPEITHWNLQLGKKEGRYRGPILSTASNDQSSGMGYPVLNPTFQ
jgi:hypothetical protein